MSAVNATESRPAGSGTMRWADAPIAAMSAAMLKVFAKITRATAKYSTGRGKRSRNSVDRPLSRVIPRRAAISWTPTANGATYRADHASRSPNSAPTWEYVPMPDGSSSAAPVTRPGPRRLK